MALISFSDERCWKMAGWVVRQILDDVMSQYPGDSAMASEFDLAKQRSWLLVDGLESGLAARVTDAIRNTATAILSGRIRSGIHEEEYGDTRTAEQYYEALKRLLELIPPAGSVQGGT